ncbi:MAG: hypothetical protein HY321_19590 [Armatimonadetes bacterium]|nr:hypothetical protein [Armatimonadota bacterium]
MRAPTRVLVTLAAAGLLIALGCRLRARAGPESGPRALGNESEGEEV